MLDAFLVDAENADIGGMVVSAVDDEQALFSRKGQRRRLDARAGSSKAGVPPVSATSNQCRKMPGHHCRPDPAINVAGPERVTTQARKRSAHGRISDRRNPTMKAPSRRTPEDNSNRDLVRHSICGLRRDESRPSEISLLRLPVSTPPSRSRHVIRGHVLEPRDAAITLICSQAPRQLYMRHKADPTFLAVSYRCLTCRLT